MTIGQIYILTSPRTNQCYVGSTTYKYLSQRFNVHRQCYNDNKGDYYGELFGTDENNNLIEPEITLLERIDFQNTEDLHKCEQKWIDTYDDLCINKKRAWVCAETIKNEAYDSVAKYHATPKGKLSLAKSAERAQIKTLTDRVEENILDLHYMLEGNDCNSAENLKKAQKLSIKISKQKVRRNKHIETLKTLCPNDPLLLSLGHN